MLVTHVVLDIDGLGLTGEHADEHIRKHGQYISKNDQMRQIASEKYEAGERQTVIERPLATLF